MARPELTEAQRQILAAQRETLEQHLATRMTQLGLPVWRTQYEWHGSRRWRADFAWPGYRLLVEVDGGTWSRGGLPSHASAAGIARDMQKGNDAALSGWTLLRFDSRMVESDEALDVITRWLTWKGTQDAPP